MRFVGFDWDDGNRSKCEKHGLSQDEIQSLFLRPVLILPDKPNPQGEIRYRAIGKTSKGRNAFIVFTWRESSTAERLLRPISARYMHKDEVIAYEKAYPNFRDR